MITKQKQIQEFNNPLSSDDGNVLVWNEITGKNEYVPIASVWIRVTQTAHGFTGAEPIYWDGTNYVLAQSNDGDTVSVYAVNEAVDADTFTITRQITDTGVAASSLAEAGITLSAGDTLFVSATESGKYTNIDPNIADDTAVSNPLGEVLADGTIRITSLRPIQSSSSATATPVITTPTAPASPFNSSGFAQATSSNPAGASDGSTAYTCGDISIGFTGDATLVHEVYNGDKDSGGTLVVSLPAGTTTTDITGLTGTVSLYVYGFDGTDYSTSLIIWPVTISECAAPSPTIATATYDSVSLALPLGNGGTADFNFNDSGEYLYYMDTTSSTIPVIWVRQLSTFWDISTSGPRQSNTTWTSVGTSRAMDIAEDGLTGYFIRNNSPRTLYRFTLTSEWDVSGIAIDPVSLELPTYYDTLTVRWNQMFMSSASTIYTYTFTDINDLSTGTLTRTMDVSSKTTKNASYISKNGLKLFVLGHSEEMVWEYDLSTAFDTDTAVDSGISLDLSENGSSSGGQKKPYICEAAWKFYFKDSNNNTLFQYSL